jgi:hypothetical protein
VVLISVRDWVDLRSIVLPEVLSQLKISVTLGIGSTVLGLCHSAPTNCYRLSRRKCKQKKLLWGECIKPTFPAACLDYKQGRSSFRNVDELASDYVITFGMLPNRMEEETLQHTLKDNSCTVLILRYLTFCTYRFTINVMEVLLEWLGKIRENS